MSWDVCGDDRRAVRQGAGTGVWRAWLCGALGDAQGMVVAVGTMHRKLERAAARHAAGGRELLCSTKGCTQAGGGSSAELGPA